MAKDIIKKPNSKFKAGKSGNPRGRPKGSKSKTTIVSEALRTKSVDIMMKELPKIVEVVVEQARAGNLVAAKMIMDRAIPLRKAEDGAGGDVGIGGINIIIGALEAPSDGRVIDVTVEPQKH